MVLKKALTLAVSLLALASWRMMAQGATSGMLLHPPPDSWPGYHGDYSGRRHSPLTQITPAKRASAQSRMGPSVAATSQHQGFARPVDGIIYFTAIDHVWALDAPHRPPDLGV